MHNPERAVTIVHRVGHDPECVHVHDVGERFFLVTHFTVDTVGRLFAAFDSGLDSTFAESVLERLQDF